jgi:hypothetical protein
VNPAPGYSEKHHIIPKSLGGSDAPENIVRLSAREHYICHLLLTKIHPVGESHFKMVRAFLMMMMASKFHSRYTPARTYQHFRKANAQHLKTRYKGAANSQFGSIWVSDPITNKTIKVPPGVQIPPGFVPGRNVSYKVCPVCSGTHIGKQLTCSKCREAVRTKAVAKVPAKRRKKEVSTKICATCQFEFQGTLERKYCSVPCASIAGNNAVVKRVIDDAQHDFKSLTAAAKYHNITVEAVRYRIKIGRYKLV